MLLLSNLICIHIIHPGGTPIRGKNADLTFTEWSCSFSLSFHPSHLCLVFRAIPILSINLISFPPFGYDSWLSYCGLSFSFFSLFCSFLYLWKWLFKFWYASKKAYPGRQTTNQSQLTICPFFFLFFFLFLFSLFFLFFLLLLPFFCPTGEKKKIIFFSSLAVLVLDQSQGGLENSGRHAEDSLDRLLFVFIFQKDFAFVLQFFFLLLS